MCLRLVEQLTWRGLRPDDLPLFAPDDLPLFALPDDLPLFAFRLHTWVHCFGMCNWDKMAALHVRVTIKEPRKEPREDCVSVETRSVCAHARGLETENGPAKEVAEHVLRQNYVWEQHVALDFNGHEDTEIVYELWSAGDDGRGEPAMVGTCRFVCDP